MTDLSRPTLSVVIPLYNEAENLPLLEARLEGLLSQLQVDSEVLFVDDHSTDETPEGLRELCGKHGAFRYLRLARNSGSHTAILAGLEHARGDCSVFLAGDLQDPPELIPQLMQQWRQGYQIVWAVREQREGISWADQLVAGIFYRLLNQFSEVTFPATGADFALLDRQVVAALLKSTGADPSLGADIASLGFRHTEILYTKRARQHGRSKWTLSKRLKAFADAFVGHSFAPVRFMSWTGITMALTGFLYALYIIIARLTMETPIEGYASLMVAVLVLGGVQMTMLGVLGEYIIRAVREARARPRYLIEESSEEAPAPIEARSDADTFPAKDGAAVAWTKNTRR